MARDEALSLLKAQSVFSRTRVKVIVERTQTEIWDGAGLLSQGHRALCFSGLPITYLSAEEFEVDDI